MKILRLESCQECPMLTHDEQCNHPRFWLEPLVPSVSDVDSIPEWCPLDDAKEQP